MQLVLCTFDEMLIGSGYVWVLHEAGKEEVARFQRKETETQPTKRIIETADSAELSDRDVVGLPAVWRLKKIRS